MGGAVGPADDSVSVPRVEPSYTSSCERPDGPGDGAGEVTLDERWRGRGRGLVDDGLERGLGVADEGICACAPSAGQLGAALSE